MSRLKARYVATVTIEINEEYVPGKMLPVEKIKENIVNRAALDLQEIISSEIMYSSVKVEQQYADVYLVEDEDHVDSDM
jgi:hypothetical protein